MTEQSGYYRTVFTVELLSTDPNAHHYDLQDVLYDIAWDGHSAGETTVTAHDPVSREYVILSLQGDPHKLRKLVPDHKPLENFRA